jgi:UDP-N-acetylmuramyl pentapeptide phosphotransferase/UDP-N-acetylglucosamine-1-phosphate transferase
MLEFEKSSKKSRLVWCLVLLFTAFMMFGGADDPTNLWANRVRMASAPIAFAGVVMLFAFLVSIHRHIHFRTPSGEIAVYTGYAGAELITKTCQTFEQAKHARMSRIRDELEA